MTIVIPLSQIIAVMMVIFILAFFTYLGYRQYQIDKRLEEEISKRQRDLDEEWAKAWKQYYESRRQTSKTVHSRPFDKKGKIEALKKELDIIKGKVPTPPGYKVSANRAKSLVKELKALEAN